MTALQLAGALGPVLAQVAGYTPVLVMTKLDEVSHDQLHAVHRCLAVHTKAAQTILRRW